jgi:uncharacterized protein
MYRARMPAHHILFYDYVEDILERRDPFREAHLERIRAEQAAGRIVMAGALGDPVTGGVLIWTGVSPEEIDAFARSDPYTQGGLVMDWRIEPWAVV